MPAEKVELADLRPLRQEVKPTQWGVAAPCSSETFKTRSSKSKPLARDWTDRLSYESASRTGSSLKGAFKHLQNPNIISLGGGLPLSEYFPFDKVGFVNPQVANGQVTEKKLESYAGKHDLRDGQSVFDLSVALNYGQGSGSAQLLRWITEHVEIVHNPRYADWQCTMSIGNTSAWDMVLRMFTKAGDVVLSDAYTFSSATETATPFGVKFVGVEMDDQGIRPDSLRHILETWDPAQHGGSPKPFLYYAIPTGQNPTGSTQSTERRKEIYRVAQEHDLLICEDDPYYFLQMDQFDPSPKPRDTPINKPSAADLVKMIVPSFLALDTDGRVIRMDSFSKVISPGLRVGWVTAPEQIIERYKKHADVSTQSPSGLSQIALFKLLDEQWGHAGFFDWLLHLRSEYTQRRDVAAHACERYLPKSLLSWSVPEAGMFLWVKLDWEKHPQAAGKTAAEIEELVWHDVLAEGALVARGSWFTAAPSKTANEVFFRITFAAAPLDKVEEAIKRWGEALRKSFNVQVE
ncbi:unnamed protein product [Clonostachys rosea]|uniref:Aminotransferase class I/classII large domain-containing protein n=1 Tax=Bionectria ochroleuca TaxID=29856 RepID=A0ABY6U2X2_BIOOC|nr:unnamed protein product [Clonostachys rosea]